VEQGRFPQLADRDDLWQVLVVLTLRKASNLARNARTQKAGAGRVQSASALEGPEEEIHPFANLISQEPGPDFAAEVADECRRLLAQLPNDSHRAVALWKMEGDSNEQIAAKLGRSLATVERKLADIRAIWDEEAAP
jgi:DNA-directed RNA polymerase specialized sigma24 family protein